MFAYGGLRECGHEAVCIAVPNELRVEIGLLLELRFRDEFTFQEVLNFLSKTKRPVGGRWFTSTHWSARIFAEKKHFLLEKHSFAIQGGVCAHRSAPAWRWPGARRCLRRQSCRTWPPLRCPHVLPKFAKWWLVLEGSSRRYRTNLFASEYSLLVCMIFFEARLEVKIYMICTLLHHPKSYSCWKFSTKSNHRLRNAAWRTARRRRQCRAAAA